MPSGLLTVFSRGLFPLSELRKGESPCVSSSFSKDTSSMRLGPNLVTSPNLNYLSKGPDSKYSHIGSPGFHLWILRNIVQVIVPYFTLAKWNKKLNMIPKIFINAICIIQLHIIQQRGRNQKQIHHSVEEQIKCLKRLLAKDDHLLAHSFRNEASGSSLRTWHQEDPKGWSKLQPPE